MLAMPELSQETVCFRQPPVLFERNRVSSLVERVRNRVSSGMYAMWELRFLVVIEERSLRRLSLSSILTFLCYEITIS